MLAACGPSSASRRAGRALLAAAPLAHLRAPAPSPGTLAPAACVPWRGISSLARTARHQRGPPTAWHEAYSPEWPIKDQFPMRKSRDLADRLVDDCLVSTHDDFLRPMDPPHEWFVAAHSSEYYYGFVNGTLDDTRWRRIGFAQRPNRAALVRRTRLEVAGTILAARHALQYGLACNTAGGAHHAHRAWGSRCTAFNDLAVAAKVLLAEGAVSRVLVCDLDARQGDGTAEILANEPRAFTLSMHCPDDFHFGVGGMIYLCNHTSDLDVELNRGTGDVGYLAALESHLPSALAAHRPDLVLYVAGVDVHADDDLGRLYVTWDGLRIREDTVLDACLSRNIPVACVMGGGYDSDHAHLAQRHAVVHHAAANAWRKYRLG